MKTLDLETMTSIEGGKSSLQMFCGGFIAGFGIGAGIVGGALVANPVGFTVVLVGIAACMASDS